MVLECPISDTSLNRAGKDTWADRSETPDRSGRTRKTRMAMTGNLG
jgi:hypothetical protein